MSAERVFISYRRADSAGWARSLHDDLQPHLGASRAFRDVAIEGGMDFRAHIEAVLDRCDVLLAVIGPRWLTLTGEDGRRRLEDPDDLVRREIARALERPDVEVIPVLVDGARMPKAAQLPPDLAPLSRRHACELSDSRWEYDVGRLAARVRELLGEPAEDAGGARGTGDPEPEAERWPVTMAWAMTGAAAIAGLLSMPLTEALRTARADVEIDRSAPLADKIGPASDRLGLYAVERGLMWALVTAASLLAAAAVVRRATGRGSLVGPAIVGIGAGALGGALGAAAYIALKDLPQDTPSEWLITAVNVGVTGAVAAGPFARLVPAAAGGECRLAAVAGGVLAGVLTPTLFGGGGDGLRAVVLAVQAVLVMGSIGAVLAAAAHREAPVAPGTAAPVRARLVR